MAGKHINEYTKTKPVQLFLKEPFKNINETNNSKVTSSINLKRFFVSDNQCVEVINSVIQAKELLKKKRNLTYSN